MIENLFILNVFIFGILLAFTIAEGVVQLIGYFYHKKQNDKVNTYSIGGNGK